jgi:ABC-2 type transport system permease protein
MSSSVATAPGAQVRQRVTFAGVLRSEWTKLRSLRSTFYSLLAAVLITVGLGTAFSAATAAHWARTSPGERAGFDPTATSLSGTFLAQLAIGVLGVMMISGEYSTGMIRASMTAVPRRVPVLWAKVVVFAVATFLLALVAEVLAFVLGQHFLATKGIAASFSDPGVIRAVAGAALYLTVVGLLGLGLGAVLRSTAGAISTLFGLLLVLPILVHFLPSNWGDHISKYLPGTAGQSLWTVRPDPAALSPWAGFVVFALYAVVALVAGALLLRRRDV